MKLSSKNVENLKLVFLGTPEFAARALEALYKAGYNIIGVIAQPDKKSGRGQKLSTPETIIMAESLGLPIYQPADKKELHELILRLQPELGVVAAYGKIIPEETIKIPKYGFLNIHGSLLPKYRGGSCIPQAILNGDKETGVSIMKLVFEMDAGPVLSQITLPIEDDDTTESLTKKLSIAGAKEIVRVIPEWIKGKIKTSNQKANDVVMCKLIQKSHARIDWNINAEDISKQIRAYYPWPIAHTTYNGKNIQIIKAHILDFKLKPGEIDTSAGTLIVGTGSGSIEILRLKPEGKNEMDANSYLNGNKDLDKKLFI